jgi:DnaJ-class molecular chaperone
MTTTRPCPYCDGKGSIIPSPPECLTCHGKGYRVEQDAQGAESSSRMVERRYQCQICNGTGKKQGFIAPKVCKQCSGTGEQKQGFIRQLCPRCMGAGNIPGPEKWASGAPKSHETCPDCKGARTILKLGWVPGNAL